MSVDTAAPPARRLTWPVPVLGLVALAGFWLGGIPGAVALYAALGVFPGMALATALGGRSSRERRWLLGLAIAPLVSAAAGWMLLAAGVALPLAARIIAAAGFAAWALLEALRGRHPRRSSTRSFASTATAGSTPGWCGRSRCAA